MKTKQSHTPGPWRIIKNNMRNDSWFIGVGPGKKVGLVEDMPEKLIVNYNIENEANARLIAAAPELLEVLKQLKDSFGSRFPDDVYKKLDQAAAKAEGMEAK